MLALGTLLPGTGGAQDMAILRAGPDRSRGIPYLKVNALRGFRGSYVVGPRGPQLASNRAVPAGGSDQPSEPEVAEVLYTRVPLVFPLEWTPARCGSLRLLEVVGAEGFTLCYRDEQGWTLFFQFPRAGEQPSWACPFAESFVRRFQILLGFVDASREPPFPAVLELGR